MLKENEISSSQMNTMKQHQSNVWYSDTLPKLLSPLIPTYSVGVLYGGPGDGTAGKLGILLRGSGSEEDLGLHLSLSRVHRHLVGHVSEFRVTIRSPLKTITNLKPVRYRNRYDQNKEIRRVITENKKLTNYNILRMRHQPCMCRA